MAKHPSHPSKAGNGNTADTRADAPETLDQVRDILFGGQMRTVETRLRGLEQRVLDEQSLMKNDFQRRLTELDVTIKKELQAQTERLKEERAKRAEDLKALAAELHEVRKSLDRRHQQLEEATGMADAELRDQLLTQSAVLSADLAKTAQRISTELDRSAAQLRADKLDTAVLATALNEIASRLVPAANGRSAKGSKGGSA